MNFILNGFHDSNLKPIPAKLISDYKPVHCFIIDNDYKTVLSALPGVTSLHFKDISLGFYPVNWLDIEPLDSMLLNKLDNCEVTVLRMMERMEPYIGTINYPKRKELYLKHVRYWNHIIKTYQISCFISGNIPHENYDYVIYCLCKVYGIKTLFFHQTIPDFIIPLDQIHPFFPELEKEYKKLRTEYVNCSIDEIELGDRAQHVFNSQVMPGYNPTPVYMKKTGLTKHISGKLILFGKSILKLFKISNYKKISDISLLRIFLNRMINRLLFIKDYRYKRFYESRCKVPDLSKNYIYLTLHLQPELSTCPLAGVFVEQLLIAQMISHSVPPDFLIYVKENPKQKSWGRTLNFYREMAKLPNVVLVSRKFDTYKLIQNCKAIATATGTAGWEGLFRQKPVIMFGEFYYQYADGVFRIQTINDLKNAIEQIVNQKVIPELKSTKLYLKAFEKLTLPGYYNNVYYQKSIYDPMNTERIYSYIKNKIE